MSHIKSNRRTPAASAVVLVLLLACLGLAACGGSSKSSSTSTNASAATTTTGATAATGPNAGRFTAVRACLQKNGITLPKLPAGKRPVPGASPGGGTGFTLPKGMSKAQYEAVVKKCGGGSFAGRGAGARFSSPVFKAALAKFATCLRQNGVNVPTPNTSGTGPVFSTKGINTSSAQFRTAETKCRSALVGAFRAGGPGGGGGAPNSGAGAAPPAG